jgi:dihydroorotate dehydrogenase
MLYSLLRPALFLIEPEKAHGLALSTLKALPLTGSNCARWPAGNAKWQESISQSAGHGRRVRQGRRSARRAAGARLRLCRGRLDHAAAASRQPKPRLFRLAEDRAVINRMGFNNGGAMQAVARLRKRGAMAAPEWSASTSAPTRIRADRSPTMPRWPG